MGSTLYVCEYGRGKAMVQNLTFRERDICETFLNKFSVFTRFSGLFPVLLPFPFPPFVFVFQFLPLVLFFFF